jgi:hypothetical protein
MVTQTSLDDTFIRTLPVVLLFHRALLVPRSWQKLESTLPCSQPDDVTWSGHLLIDWCPKNLITFSNIYKCLGFWVRLAVITNSNAVLFAICLQSSVTRQQCTKPLKYVTRKVTSSAAWRHVARMCVLAPW